MSPEKKAALKKIREWHLIDHGHWIHLFITFVLEHPQPMKMAESLIILNEAFNHQLAKISRNSSEGNFIKWILSQLIENPNPQEALDQIFTLVRKEIIKRMNSAGVLAQSDWESRVITMFLTHSNPLELEQAFGLLNHLFMGQLAAIRKTSSTGIFIDMLFTQLSEEKSTPSQIMDSYNTADKRFALEFAKDQSLLTQGEWTAFLVMVILKHPNSRELACALILLNRLIYGRLTQLSMAHIEGNFYMNLIFSLLYKEHPFKSIAAFSVMLRVFRYRYTFALAHQDQLLMPFHIYFSCGENGLINFSLITKDLKIHTEQEIKIKAPQDWSLASLEAIRDEILTEIHSMGLLDHYNDEWFSYFFNALVTHATPYSFSLLLSKFNDLNFWEQPLYIQFLKYLCDHSAKWLVHPEFLYLFMQLPQSTFTPSFMEHIVQNTQGIHFTDPITSVLARLDLICVQFKNILGCEISGLPLNPYINYIFQKEEFIKAFPESQTMLFDVSKYPVEEYFEPSISILRTGV